MKCSATSDKSKSSKETSQETVGGLQSFFLTPLPAEVKNPHKLLFIKE